jgi:hypothetical protein
MGAVNSTLPTFSICFASTGSLRDACYLLEHKGFSLLSAPCILSIFPFSSLQIPDSPRERRWLLRIRSIQKMNAICQRTYRTSW